MTEPDARYGEELRRALSVVVDPLQPAGDGLERIRARTAHRSPVLAWFTAYVTYLPAALVTWVRVAASWASTTATHPSVLIARLRSFRHRPRRPRVWLRPALAVTGAVAFVVIATLLVPRLRHTVEVAIEGNETQPGISSNAPGHKGGPGRIYDTGSYQISSGSYRTGPLSSGMPTPCLRTSHHGGRGPSGTPTVLIPLGPMPGPSQSVPPQVLGVLPPGPSPVVPNSCNPSMAIRKPQAPGSTPTSSQPTSTPPTTPTSTPPTTPTSPPPTTPTTPPPTSPTPAGGTSPTGNASASPIPG